MRREDFEFIALFITITGAIAGFVLYWVGRAINLAGKIKELEMNRSFDKQEINELKEDVKQLQRWYNEGRNN